MGAFLKLFGHRIPFRYNAYLFALDIFGVISAGAVIAYIFVPEALKLSDQRVDGMVANVLSELVGIYISVRLIEWFTERNQTRDRVRVRVVRNMRLLERMSRTAWLHKNGLEVYNFRRELHWIEGLRAIRAKNFSADELEDIEDFFRLVKLFTEQIVDFDVINHKGAVQFHNAGEADSLLPTIEAARKRAEENILEETDEDTGMW